MAKQVFTTKVRVLYGDTDAGGVVYHANYLRYFEAGRSELMRASIRSYAEIEEMGYILPLTESWTRFKAPARYDDLLLIETWIEEVNDLKCKFGYRVCREEEGLAKPRLLVKGYTVHVAITRAGKLTRLPAEITEMFRQLV